ncbi:RDD family protein [Sulfurospirillum sp. 1612]|uniref:RDD family protein n=1 Tax=Sulfurospirillum sp. 1612 TaxID=3094835 RepID=UPI002F9590B6
MNDDQIIETFERENITLASIKKRLWAYTIDEILISVIFVIIYMGIIPPDATYEQIITLINSMFIYVVSLKIIYQTFFVWYYGATPGKILSKIRVISTVDIENPNLLSALNRAIVRIISESFFYIGFLWAFANPKRETWHDKIAKTLVVNVY